jgi:cytidylate kinase
LYYLHEVILALGHHGDVIIVGRGAQFLIPKECALRVRVIEPEPVRVERVSRQRQISLEAALQFVREREANRFAFIRTTFHEDPAAPLNYDLVLNTAQLSPPGATEIILSAMQQKLGVDSALSHA